MGRKRQHWYFTHWWDNWFFNGVKQPALGRLGNRGTQTCLDIAGYAAEGGIGTYHCEWAADQFFFIYSRGKVLGQGYLQNSKSKEVMDVSGYDGYGNVGTFVADDHEDQVWTLYESGELVNSQSHWCLDVCGYDGRGCVGTYPCEAEKDQRWFLRTFQNSKFMIVNSDSSQCVDVSGYDGKGDIATYDCQYVHDQAWSWKKASDWSPIAYWEMHGAGCHTNEFQYSLRQGVSGSATFTKEFSVSVARSISAGVKTKYGGADTSMSIEVSATLSKSFT